MVRGGLGGGNTQTGIHFEGRVDIVTYLNDEVDGYRCDQKTLNNKNQSMGFNIYYNGNLVAESFKKHELYRYLDSNPEIAKINSHLTLKYKTDKTLIYILNKATKINK